MRAWISVVAVMLALPVQGCATWTYSAEPMHGWVVDSETQKPVEGVNVVAYWALEGGMEGGSTYGMMEVLETVSDADGSYSLPGWGPKERPDGVGGAHLTFRDPELIFFKNGYRPSSLNNSRTLAQMHRLEPAMRTSDWNGKTISIEKFSGSVADYAQYLRGTLYFAMMPIALGYTPCAWRNIPNMLLTLVRLDGEFAKARVSHNSFPEYIRGIDEHYAIARGCGAPKQFLDSLGK